MNTIAHLVLERGRVRGRDLREEAARLRELGATWAHATDADAAAGLANQWAHVRRILDAGLQVSWGGGVRSLTQVQQLLDLGVQRVLLGRQAVANPLWFREAGRIFGARVGLDVSGQGGDAAAHARGLHDAGHGCTLVDAAAPAALLREAGAPVWVRAASAQDGAAWEGADAILLETGALEDGAALQRWLPPVPARRRTLALRQEAPWPAAGGGAEE